MVLQNHSEDSYIAGNASFKIEDEIFKLEFIQECDTDDGEEPKFWQIKLEGSNSFSVQITPSHLPWSLPAKMEIRYKRSGLEPGLMMDFVCLLLNLIIATEDDVPDWLSKVFAIIDDLTDDFSGNTLPSSCLSEE